MNVTAFDFSLTGRKDTNNKQPTTRKPTLHRLQSEVCRFKLAETVRDDKKKSFFPGLREQPPSPKTVSVPLKNKDYCRRWREALKQDTDRAGLQRLKRYGKKQKQQKHCGILFSTAGQLSV